MQQGTNGNVRFVQTDRNSLAIGSLHVEPRKQYFQCWHNDHNEIAIDFVFKLEPKFVFLNKICLVFKQNWSVFFFFKQNSFLFLCISVIFLSQRPNVDYFENNNSSDSKQWTVFGEKSNVDRFVYF